MHGKAEVLQHFNDFAIGGRWAKLYDRNGDAAVNYSFIIRRRRAYELLMPALKPGRHVLDVGCGPGVMAPFILKHGARYFGLDYSEQMVAQAVRQYADEAGRGVALQFAVGDVEAMAYPDAHFDVVMALGVLEYLAETQTAVTEILRTTRVGGTILVSVPIAFCPDDIACKVFSPWVTGSARAVRRMMGKATTSDHFSHRRFLPDTLDSLFTSRGCEKTGFAYYNLELATYPLRRVMPAMSLRLKRWIEPYHRSLLRMFATAYIGRYVKREAATSNE